MDLFRQQGIEPKLEYIYSSDVAEGLVISQSVMGGEILPENTEVVLTISKGPDPDQEPAGSEDPQVSNAVQVLRLNRSSLSLYVGDSVTLTASGGTGNYQWSSNAGSVASVRGGVVTAAGAGRAVITVSSGTETATCSVTVRDYSLTMSQSSLSMAKGNSVNLSVSGAPAGTTVSWASSNASVATVRDGQVTAAGTGTAVITASMAHNGKLYTAICEVAVAETAVAQLPPPAPTPTPTPAPAPEEGIKLSNTSISLEVNSEGREIKPMSVTTTPKGQTVTWRSSNTSVAYVMVNKTSDEALIFAMGAGTATITVQMNYNGNTYTDTCQVTVELVPTPMPTPTPTPTSTPMPTPTPVLLPELVGDIELSVSSIELQVGESKNLTATTTPSGQTVTWSSSNTSVATVNNGQVTAMGPGTAIITAQMYYSGKTYADTCQVTVTALEGSIKLSSTSLSLEAGKTETLAVTTTPSGQSVTWSSSDTKIATVSNGTVTSISEGTAIITAGMSYGGKTYSSSCTVQVSPAQKRLSSITVRASSISLAVGDSIIVTATANYQNAPSEDITSIANFYPYTEGVAVCNGNTVTGIAEGTVLIMVEYKNFAGYVRIYVNSP